MWLTNYRLYPNEGQFVINGQSCGHNGAKAPSLNAVLLQYLLLDVSRKITIALMVGWNESSIFVVDSNLKLWLWEYFMQEYLTQIGDTWEFSLQAWDFIIIADNREIEKWLKSLRI